MQREALKIGITAGDPAGIGPEVALKAINAIRDDTIIPVLIGRKAVFEKHYRDLFVGYDIIGGARHAAPLRDSVISQHAAPLHDSVTSNNAEPLRHAEPGKKYLYDVPLDLPVPAPGRGCADTGKEALACIDAAIALWKAGDINAVVTGPVSKQYIEKTGVPFTGHTEYIAGKIGESGPLMMMYSPKYRVLLASTHVPVSEIMEHAGMDRLMAVMRTGYESVRAIDGGRVRLAVTGLDPHCGDDGAIGTYDRDVTAPAIRAAREQGMPVEGPFAADTLFIPSTWERYSLVIAHYHDQGLIPFKMLAFDEGVNVTLGLSIVRTSVDHGTAFDIAGNNAASWRSMTEAIRLAHRLASLRTRE